MTGDEERMRRILHDAVPALPEPPDRLAAIGARVRRTRVAAASAALGAGALGVGLLLTLPAVMPERNGPAVPAAAASTPSVPDRAALLGQWVSTTGTSPSTVPGSGGNAGFIRFLNDTEWVGSDGCNVTGGHWAVGPEGLSLVREGGITEKACVEPAQDWVIDARRAVLDDGALVLFDAAGKQTGRLRRAG